MLCESPSTSETVGFDIEAIISARASPALTSPPTVFIRNNTPSISSLSSIDASCGRICSYFVDLLDAGRTSCPSISPIIVINVFYHVFYYSQALPVQSPEFSYLFPFLPYTAPPFL